MDISRVVSIKNNNNKPVDYARKEQEVAIKVWDPFSSSIDLFSSFSAFV